MTRVPETNQIQNQQNQQNVEQTGNIASRTVSKQNNNTNEQISKTNKTILSILSAIAFSGAALLFYLEKISLIAFGSVTLIALAGAAYAFGHEIQVAMLASNPKTATLSTLEGVEWARECLTQYPELKWLANADVKKTSEGQATDKDPYSVTLFGQKFDEFDRSIMSLHCLRLFFKADGENEAYDNKYYTRFTQDQDPKLKLTEEHFKTICERARKLVGYKGLTKAQVLATLETGLVLGDMGKSPEARKLFEKHGVNEPDHDDFFAHAMLVLQKNPSLCPSFAELPKAAQELLVETSDLAHFGHITHLEGDETMFSKLKTNKFIKENPQALEFAFFMHLCDVAGALGHKNKNSSLMYLDETHRAISASTDACRLLTNKDATEKEAYDSYLKVRAKWLGIPEDKVYLARIGTMMRLFTEEQGKVILDAVQTIPQEDRNIVEEYLKNQMKLGRTPTYVPSVLVNLHKNEAISPNANERLHIAVMKILPFIAKILKDHETQIKDPSKRNPNVPLCFRNIAEEAKDPKIKEKGNWDNYTVDPNGDVNLKRDI